MPEYDNLLKDIRERHAYALGQWHDIRDEGQTDMRYVSGDPWDPADRDAREKAKRPCLAVDELGQYFNAVINDVRANPRGMKFAPTGGGASEQTAQFYADKAREIEYRSNGPTVYTTAFENAVQRSYGFVRVTTRYVSDRSFNQEIWLEPFMNPDAVLPDPDAVWPDSRDMGYCFVVESRSAEDFKREFPKAKVQSFSAEVRALAPKFFQGGADSVQLAEYWTFKTTAKQLLLIEPQAPAGGGFVPGPAPTPLAPVEVFADEPRPPGRVLRERTVDVKQVCQYLTNGVEILSKTEWPGKYIPIVSCYGKVLFLVENGKTTRKLLSMTRLARDPFMAYCFYRTCEMENVGMTTKNPYWAYEGQLSATQMQEIAKSLHEPVAVLFAKPITPATGAQMLPLPVRNVNEPAIQALSIGAEEMRRAIQAAMGSTPLPTEAQRRNEKSGKALNVIEQSAQRGTFHFVDHYNGMIERVGQIIEDLIDKVYDTAREVAVRKPNEDAASVPINGYQSNKPDAPPPVSTKGDHQVTVSAGPSFDSERDAASQFADLLLQTPFAPVVADLAIKLKNLGPIGDELAERVTPPQFKKPKDGQGPDPQQLQQAIAQMQQQNQQLMQQLQQMALELKTQSIKVQSDERIAIAKIQSEEKKAGVKASTDVQTTELANASRERIAQLEAQLERMQLALEARDAELDRAQERYLAEQGQQAALELQAAKPTPAPKANGAGA